VIPSIEVRGLRKQYGKKIALHGLSFSVEEGELFCLLGPPGAGKTTTLRLIAGLDRPDEGDILMDGRSIEDVPPQHRDLAMVFEDMALYPHMTGLGNIAHGLYLRKIGKEEVHRRVEEMAELLRIGHLLSRYPQTYSGGERRRVALARGLARRPKVLLLDQALSGLDAKIRQEMTGEIKALQQEIGQTMVYATHDFEEGAAMADRCLVVRSGQGVQLDDPQTLYVSPDTPFVAGIIGSPAMNLVPCRMESANGNVRFVNPAFRFEVPLSFEEGREVVLGIRPEHMRITESGGTFPATVEVIQTRGLERIVDLRVGDGLNLKTIVSAEIDLELGQTVQAVISPDRIYVFDARTGRRLLPHPRDPAPGRGDQSSSGEE
jgi:multiple sugar transport system ATP-binding protein